MMTRRVLANVACVAVGGRGVLIQGPPGSGKSSLALTLIDRGAVLVGDDGVMLERKGDALWALPPPNIAGMLEIRGVGIATVPAAPAPVALVLALGGGGERLPTPTQRAFEGVQIPCLSFDATTPDMGPRAEWALRLHGLPVDADAVAATK